MGQSAWYQFTTADRSGNNHRLFIRRWAFCQSRGGSCPKHHIRRNVCLLRWPRKGGPREAAETKREGSHDRNHRLAFFSFKHPLHQPPPDLSSIPCRLSSRSKECSCTRSFPLFTSEAKGCVSDVFLPAVLSDAFQSLRFRFFSLTSCSTLRVGNLINIHIQLIYNKIMKYYIELIKIICILGYVYHILIYRSRKLGSQFGNSRHATKRLSWSIMAACLEGRGIARYIWTRTIGHVDLLQDERRGMTGGRCATRIVYRTHVHARGSSSSNHQLPIRRVDSWKHGSRSKISGSDMALPPSPYMATSRAYTRLLRKWERDRELEKERREKGKQ